MALAAERSRATFPVAELTERLHGGAAALARTRELRALVEQDPAFRRPPPSSREQLFAAALCAARRFVSLVREHALDAAAEQTVYEAIDAVLPIDVHRSMFLPALEAQTTDEQRAAWLPLARSYAIVGAYAQTELGHGSNVRAIETRATFLPATDELELHTPSLTAAKWWPGGLAFTATHAIVYARLLVRGVDHGVHGVLVQLRSLDDHAPLPGVRLFDIGAKLGFNEIDNGAATFERVRVPRRQLLMRFATLSADGEYTPPAPSHAKLGYLTMLHVRAALVRSCGACLARALTIAVRYSAVRTQGGEAAAEPAVLEYASQRAELLPRLAAAYAMHFGGAAAFGAYEKVRLALAGGSADGLPRLHASLAALKALTTYEVADGVEAARRACGGHGYLLSSGLPALLGRCAAYCTLEGTRDVLEQQAARYLLKQHHSSDPPPPPPPLTAASLSHLPALTAAFDAVAAFLTAAAHRLLATSSWNDSLVELGRLSRAHAHATLLSSFAAAVAATPSPPLHAALHSLCELHALTTLLSHAADFIEAQLLPAALLPAVRARVRALLHAVRPNAVALVEAWDFSDFLLHSTLGASDGRVYERLVEAAKAEPLNHLPARSLMGSKL
ncbi:hypothetical protein AB1Y20_016258 [Prymnesium parvum]|uniref:Acyl-coenzyme A oxidase n=1 Tax=Prymnesium parvum TaxID=97485 RepID=A0AB34IEP6_PRYPA